jgi:hypothetical protein
MLAGEIGQRLPSAFAPAAAAPCALSGGTIAARSARLPWTIAAAAGSSGSRAVALSARSLAWSAESLLRSTAAAPLRAHRTPAVPEPRSWLVAVELAAAPSARLPNREVRFLAFWLLPFRTRQLRANQTAMDGTVFLVGRSGRQRDGVRIGVVSWRRCVGQHLRRVLVHDVGLGSVFHLFGLFRGVARAQYAFRRLAGDGVGPLAARWRNASGFVLMIRVAGGTARLLHLILNHGDDGMIGNAALARTIVVQNVTEPKPALLHQTLRSRSFQVGYGKV